MPIVRAELVPPPWGGSMEAWIDWGECLPASRAMGLRCHSMKPGHAVVVMDASEWPLNPSGAVHGGLVLAWADHCFALAAMPTLPPGSAPATASLSAQFLRPAMPPLTFDARVDRTGRTLVFLTVDVYDAHGRLATKVSGTMSTDGTSRFLEQSTTVPSDSATETSQVSRSR